MSQPVLQQWVTQNSATPGLLGLAIFAPGQTNFVQSCQTGFLPDLLEKAWRAVTETISVLQLNRFPTARFRFVYGRAIVHCERRRDGACLGIFASREGGEATNGEIDRLLTEFHAIQG